MSECAPTGNTGIQYCSINDIQGDPLGFAFLDENFSLAEADALTYASWITEIQNRRAFPVIHLNYMFASNDEEMQKHDVGNGTMLRRRDGKYRDQHTLYVNSCIKKELRTFQGFKGRIASFYEDPDTGGGIIAMTTDGTNATGARLSNTFVHPIKKPLSDGTPANLMIETDLLSAIDLNENSYIRKVSWDPRLLQGLTPVTLSVVGTPSATEIVVDVQAVCGTVTKNISGIAEEAASFVIQNGTILNVVESATVSGRYTITGTTFATGTLALGAPTDRTDTVLVIDAGAITVTIS